MLQFMRGEKMIGVICFTLITFVLSLLIVLLNDYLFKRKSKSDELVSLLPGYNCGACGFGSCMGMSNELLKDKDAMSKCKFIKNKEEILEFLSK